MTVDRTPLELSRILGISERAVRLRAQNENWTAISTNGKGGKQKRFAHDLLPEDVRNAISVNDTQNKGLVPIRPIPDTAHNISEEVKRIGLAKFNLVQAYREVVLAAPWGGRQPAVDAFLVGYNSGRLLPNVFSIVGEIKEPTLRAWDKKLRDHNDDYTCICDGRGGWKIHGTTKWRPRTLSSDAQTAFLQCYLQPGIHSIESCIRATRMILAKKGIDENCGGNTYRRWLADWMQEKAHVACLAREGEKAYVDKHGPYMTRNDGLLEVGQVLVPDGKTLNFQILHPDTGRPVRMVLIVFQDWASRCPVGWQIMPTENAIAIHAAFYNAVLTLGKIPTSIYMDNGRAFKSKVFTDTDPDLDEMIGLYARIGTVWQNAKPYSGRTKPVERFFQTLQDQLEGLLPSYVGDSIATKPPWMHRNEKFHQAWHQARTGGWIPTIYEASQIVDAYFQWHVQQPHSGINYQRPIDVLDRGRGPGVDMQKLNFDFLWRFTAAPRRCRITRWGIDYQADFLEGITYPVLCLYNTADLETIYCYDRRNTYLGEARPVEAVHPMARLFGDQVSLDAVQRENKRQARLKKRVKESLLAIGADQEDVEALSILPWNRKAAILSQNSLPEDKPGQKALPAEPAMSDDECRRLSLVYDRAKEALKEVREEVCDRPERFNTPLERYEWCFRALYQYGKNISREDKGFMADFQSDEEYEKLYKGRFDDLRALFLMNGPELAMG
ncbi:MAG: integrase [Pseudomonadota bacterium]